MTELMRWRVFAYVAALFIAGVITGAAVKWRTVADGQTLKVGRWEEIATRIRERLNQLDLTPEQQRKFEPLIKATSMELEASHLECLQRSSAAVDKLHALIKQDLTPEQITKLTELEAERRALMKSKYNYPPEAASTNGP